ncbi:MAG: DUF4097 family beta strand repeat protein [Clostridia bacterium]|nr:DUF4097 family beta strand repeat protein [Clostridia bacterium]
MSKSVKIWLIIAASLILIGCVAFVGVMTVLRWDFAKLSTVQYETRTYEIGEDYKNISIVSDTADIVLVPSQDAKSAVECYEQKNVKHAVAVKDSTLVIEITDARKWYERIEIGVGSPKIIVYLPQGEYGALSVRSDTGDMEIAKGFCFESIDISQRTGNVTNYASATGAIKIKTTTGDICVENVSAGSLELSVSTGDTDLADIACKSMRSEGDTGDLLLKNVIAEQGIFVTRTTGDVTFEGADAAEIIVQTDTGDVKGSLLSDKVFVTSTDTGRVRVPSTATGGRCEITTDTGDIQIRIQQ